MRTWSAAGLGPGVDRPLLEQKRDTKKPLEVKAGRAFQDDSEEYLRSCSLAYVISLPQINSHKNYKKIKKGHSIPTPSFHRCKE